MDVTSLNGGTLLAMRGKECVTIASDLRLGSRMLTVQTDKTKAYKMGDLLYVGLAGLATDCQTIVQRLTFRKNLYELRENRTIKPKTLTKMLSNMLYEKRFGPYFCDPIIAGLDPVTYESYVSGQDLIGCICEPEDFVTIGTGQNSVLGMCENFWEKNMDADTLFEATAQALLGALERDAASGWGAIVYLITKEGVTAKTLKARLD